MPLLVENKGNQKLETHSPTKKQVIIKKFYSMAPIHQELKNLCQEYYNI